MRVAAKKMLTLTSSVGMYYTACTDAVGVGTLSGTIHNDVIVHVHVNTIMFFYLTLSPLPTYVTVTLHPILYSFITEISEYKASLGTT